MRFSLRQLLVGLSVFALWLAIACWHPVLALGIALLAAFPGIIALASRRRALIVFGAVAASVTVGFLWFKSYELSMSVGWGPSTIVYQATSRRGQVHFFRFVRHSGGNLRPWIAGEEPVAEHWSEFPGFYEEQFFVRVPGLEFARSEYLVPIGMRPAVDYVEVLTISYWLIVAAYFACALPFAYWAGGKPPPAKP
jgi:hypothetical protein